MKTIKELIVVEGKHDSANLKRFFAVETRETGGVNVSRQLLEDLKVIASKKDIIIFTDPDSSGNKIREIISKELPNCKHAYLQSKDCRHKDKVGIEHANREVLERALNNLISYHDLQGELTMSDLIDLGLSAGDKATLKRQKISAFYNLGDCNGKSLLKRLNALNITKEELEEKQSDE